MQATSAFRRSSINSIAAMFAIVLALTAGGAGGYWLKSLAPSVVKAAPAVAGAHDMNATRHAAQERAEADLATSSGLALSVARHAAQERADASIGVLSNP